MRNQLGKLLAMAIAVSVSTLWAINKGPDAASYTATDNTVYSFIDARGGGGSASVLAGSDDAVALLTLPFPFQFYGKSYTLVCASSNGILSFVTSAAVCAPAVDFANTDLTATAPPGDRPAILPFWTDLSFQPPAAGAVYYQTLGTAGSRRFVVEWASGFPQGGALPVTFEVVLSEGSNRVLFQYQTIELAGDPSSKGALATVGIRDSGGNTNNRQIAWSYNAAVLTNGSAILFTPPAGAQTSVNTVTTSPAGLSVTIDGVAYTTPKVVSWTPGTNHTIAVATPQANGPVRNTFKSWSTGASTPQIAVSAPPTGTTYTATFTTEYQLTTAVNPAASGTITSSGWKLAGSVVPIQATAAAGYAFVNFSGALTGSQNPQNVTMNAPKNVVANFQVSAKPSLTASVVGKADGAPGQRVWTIRLSNTGPGSAASAQLTAFALTQISGAPCTPAVVTTLPVPVGTIAAGANASAPVTLNFASCTDATARFSAKINFSANSGAYTGSTTISNQAK